MGDRRIRAPIAPASDELPRPTDALRVVVSANTDPVINLAQEDEHLLEVEAGSRAETLRLWSNRECIVRGPNRVPSSGWHDEDLALRLDVPIHRRSTGGGSVYHDLGNLNWSFYLRRVVGYVGAASLFAQCAEIVVEALAVVGVNARFSLPNRIDVGACKISGMASRAIFGAVIVHGTVLVSTDLERLNALCTPPPGCPPVTRLCDLDPAITMANVMQAFRSVTEAARRTSGS